MKFNDEVVPLSEEGIADIYRDCLRTLHSQAVIDARANFVPNRVLGASPPDISPLENLLPRSVRTYQEWENNLQYYTLDGSTNPTVHRRPSSSGSSPPEWQLSACQRSAHSAVKSRCPQACSPKHQMHSNLYYNKKSGCCSDSRSYCVGNLDRLK